MFEANWGEDSDVTSLYRHLDKQGYLERSLVRDRCRLVSLLGIGGVEKMALAIKVARQIQVQFDYVV